nr:hypothetical protein [Brevundimonas guildfordensis]
MNRAQIQFIEHEDHIKRSRAGYHRQGLAFSHAAASPHGLVDAVSLGRWPDDHSALRRDDDAVAAASYRIVLRRGDSALQRCKTLLSGARPLEGLSKLFSRGNERCLALATLLQEAFVLASRHEPALQQGPGFDNSRLEICQIGLSGGHRPCRTPHLHPDFPSNYPGGLGVRFQPGGFGFRATSQDIRGVKLEQALAGFDLISILEQDAGNAGVERRTQVDPLARRHTP